MSKHTPGPWTFHETHKFICDRDGDHVGQAFRIWLDDKEKDEERAIANGRLMAAAPELFTMVGRLGFVLSEITDSMNVDLDGTCIQIKSSQGIASSISLSELFEQVTTLVNKIKGGTNE